jgi:hypothetical protein
MAAHNFTNSKLSVEFAFILCQYPKIFLSAKIKFPSFQMFIPALGYAAPIAANNTPPPPSYAPVYT